jgi:alanine racemase
MIHFAQLEKICQGKILQLKQDVVIDHLLIDSRKAILSAGAVFFAISGSRNDGHAYVEKLYQEGIRNFVVEKEVKLPAEANIILVSSAVQALQQVAAAHRKTFTFPIIGITGSNGKTIIKEWLYQLLANHYAIVKNPGSYNSQVGVPLSVWNIRTHHKLGIFEAGISRKGEMQALENILKPTMGIFTNIGPAHAEGFSSLKEKVEEKAQLFSHSDLVIYCKDHSIIDEVLNANEIKRLSWGYTQNADVLVEKGEGYTLHYGDLHYTFRLPFTDAASVENCLHCVVVMMHLGLSEADIQTGLQALRSVAMRLELKEGINQCQLIDDSYNNDLAGLQVSLDFLNNQYQKSKKTLILSDILQSGDDAQHWTKSVADLIRQNKIDRFIAIGKALSAYQNYFEKQSAFYDSTEAFLQNLSEDQFSNEIILIKGARSFTFEKIVARLQRKVHGTIMEINLGNMVHNLNYFRSTLKPSTKIMAMVKAFAYGSGSKEVASLLQYHKVDYLGVAYADEGVELRKNNIHLPIMVMNPSPETFEALILYNLEPEVFNLNQLKQLLVFLNGRPCTIHVKFDTGMHRLGFASEDLSALISLIQQNKNIHVATIFSHLAGADDPQHDDYSAEQATLFKGLADQLSTALGYKPIYHLLNSPGILRLGQYQFDMVRLGIGLYGIDPTPEKSKSLKPVATLKTIVSQVHHLKNGQTVGYGRHGKITDDQSVATIAIGYADGYSRAFSKGIGKVLVKGKVVPVMGNVCMDMTMVDVTGLTVQEGDEVIVFGEQLPIEQVAESIHTIPYEILTNTSERVKRVFVAESI